MYMSSTGNMFGSNPIFAACPRPSKVETVARQPYSDLDINAWRAGQNKLSCTIGGKVRRSRCYLCEEFAL
jgi:hypothetical protein